MPEYLQKCDKLYKIVEQFIEDQNIWCDECVYQTDRVIENAYPFIAQLCDVVGYKQLDDEDA
jgi:glutaminase